MGKFKKNQWVRVKGDADQWMGQCNCDSYFDPGYGKEVVSFKKVPGMYDVEALELVPQGLIPKKGGVDVLT